MDLSGIFSFFLSLILPFPAVFVFFVPKDQRIDGTQVWYQVCMYVCAGFYGSFLRQPEAANDLCHEAANDLVLSRVYAR